MAQIPTAGTATAATARTTSRGAGTVTLMVTAWMPASG